MEAKLVRNQGGNSLEVRRLGELISVTTLPKGMCSCLEEKVTCFISGDYG